VSLSRSWSALWGVGVIDYDFERTFEYIYIYSLVCKYMCIPATVQNWLFTKLNFQERSQNARQKKLLLFFPPLWFDLFIYILNIFVCLTFLPHHGQSKKWSEYFLILCPVMAPRTVATVLLSFLIMIMFRKWSRSLKKYCCIFSRESTGT